MAYKIAKIIDRFKVVMNAGSNQKISKGQKFLIYELSDEEIIDPDTGEVLPEGSVGEYEHIGIL